MLVVQQPICPRPANCPGESNSHGKRARVGHAGARGFAEELSIFAPLRYFAEGQVHIHENGGTLWNAARGFARSVVEF